MKLKKFLFTLVLAFPLSNISLAQINSQVLSDSNELRRMEAEDRARQQASKNQHRKDAEKPKSMAGLDKQAQTKELTQSIVTMFASDKSLEFFQAMASKGKTKSGYEKSANCFKNQLNIQEFYNFVYPFAKNYVDNHTPEQVQQNLKWLIDYSFNEEMSNYYYEANIEPLIKNTDLKEAKKMADYSLQLRLMQQPYFRKAVEEILNNPANKDLKNLLRLDSETKPYFNEYMTYSINKCKISN